MDQLRNKLSDYAVQPPARVWNAIASSLDEGMPVLSQKLSDFTANPPPHLWTSIESSLPAAGEKRSAVVVPFYRRTFFRAAVAAFIFMAVFLGIRQTLDLGETPQITAVKQPTPVTKTATVPAAEPAAEPETPQAETKTWAPAKNPAKEVASRPRTVKSRYITFANDDGQTVRLSKKVVPFFICATARIQSVSQRCKENIELLQEKMGSSLTPPTSDFAGLIDLLKTLEDNR